jgi:hypothetical protein
MIAPGIVSPSVDVLAAVEFDYDRAVQAGEVADVESNLMLGAKLEAGQLPSAEAAPEKALCIRQIFPQGSDVALHGEAEYSEWTKMWREYYLHE